MSINSPKRLRQQEKLRVKCYEEYEDLICDKKGKDPIMMTATGFEVKRIIVDSGGAVEVLIWEAYQKMGLKESEERVRKLEAAKVMKTLQLFYDDTEKFVKISSVLMEEEKRDLVQCLRENSDIFAWSAANMPSVDPRVIVHRLNMCFEGKRVKQKRRRFAPQVVEAIRQEVGKLLSVGFIREVV
ncbi:Transposon Ty3-G Gag-Pol polyprotein [Gossypium australe]|uniref:Transposon Ty3-G Gag-Pol polyprotein n=1 Tax=Gossypium australe TaxID=47621 RepID=A0A5B6WEL3_9ROSI|nr:Transposon Ty3-G Gag-Pol polyprotein [Gossypium australe]